MAEVKNSTTDKNLIRHVLTLLQRVAVNHVTSVAPRFDSLAPKPDRAAVVRTLNEAPVPVPKFDCPVLECQAPGRLLCSRWMFRWRGRCGKRFHTWTMGKGCFTWAPWMQSFQIGSLTSCIGSQVVMLGPPCQETATSSSVAMACSSGKWSTAIPVGGMRLLWSRSWSLD